MAAEAEAAREARAKVRLSSRTTQQQNEKTISFENWKFRLSLLSAFISSPPFLSGNRRRRRAEGLAGPERGLRGHRGVLLRPPVEILAGMSTL